MIKFSGTDGTQLWHSVIHGSADLPGFDVAEAVAVNSAGTGASAGIVDTDRLSTSKFTVVHAGEGAGWIRFITGSDHTVHRDNEATAVTMDSAGDVIAVGSLREIGAAPAFTVIKLSGGDGTERLRRLISGSANDGDGAQAVTVDALGNVTAAGFLTNIGTGGDFTVNQFNGSSGDERWRQVIDAGRDESAQAVTVDGAGDVLAAGTFAAIKFSGTNGTELWRQFINGHNANAIAVDRTGDVVSAGARVGFLAAADWSVIKLRGVDGTDF